MEAQIRSYKILKLLFGLLPIAAGADKFFNLLVDWEMYLAPVVTDILPLSPSTIMGIAGLIEIIAGMLVFSRYGKLASLIVALWLVLIAINLMIIGYLDIAVRDLALAVCAYVLFILSPSHPQDTIINSTQS